MRRLRRTVPLVNGYKTCECCDNRENDQNDKVNPTINDAERLKRSAAEKAFDSAHSDFNQPSEMRLSFPETF